MRTKNVSEILRAFYACEATADTLLHVMREVYTRDWWREQLDAETVQVTYWKSAGGALCVSVKRANGDWLASGSRNIVDLWELSRPAPQVEVLERLIEEVKEQAQKRMEREKWEVVA